MTDRVPRTLYAKFESDDKLRGGSNLNLFDKRSTWWIGAIVALIMIAVGSIITRCSLS